MAENKKYYLSINDQNVGPLTFEDIVTRLKNGLLSGESYIFTSGDPTWVRIRDLIEFGQYTSEISPDDLKTWFVRKDRQNIGPMSKKELLTLLYNGNIDNNDYVWRKGLGNWSPIKDLYELRATKEIMKDIKIDENKLLQEKEIPKKDLDEDTLKIENPNIEVNMPKKPLTPIQEEGTDSKTVTPPIFKRPKRMLPEFMFGILLLLIGAYEIENNLMLGGATVGIGFALVISYLVMNRKREVNQ